MYLSEEELESIERNARAYGFEIGRGRSHAEAMEPSEDNPFLVKDWRLRPQPLN